MAEMATFQGSARPELKALVVEASQALARLDAARLQELAVACQALNRNLTREAVPAEEAREAMDGRATFARVLEATRANLKVMRRLRELRMGHIEYSERQAHGWAATEGHNGND